ncbi:glycosyltransferase family 1 protein [Candidatus Parcubacteria bacterium]|nr:glycosyltransferase family 1 protein [Candidatus Parcubacteria bacterium]
MSEIMSKKKRKILYVITKGNFGGAQRYVFDLATSLSRENFDVVVAFGESGMLQEKLKNAGVRTIEINSLKRDVGFLDLKVFFELIKIFRSEEPDVVHLNSSKIGGLGALAGRLTLVPRIIFTAHAWAWNEDRNIFSKIIIAKLHWLTVLFSHKTITVSASLAKQMIHFPFVSKKLLTIHNGIAPFTTEDGFKARQIIGPAIHHGVWIGTISELHKSKGLDFLIEAFSRISSQYKDCGLVIVSDGEEKASLVRLVAEKKLQDRVDFLGVIPNAKVYLKAFDIFTLTSRTEALPYSLLEAGFAQLPILASRVGGIPEIIDAEENGVLVEKGNVDEIEKGLIFLLENNKIGAKYGLKLKQKIEREFMQNEMVKKTETLYN